MDRADSPIFWKGSPVVPANARPAEDPRAPSGTRGSAEARTSCSEVYLELTSKCTIYEGSLALSYLTTPPASR